MFSYYAKKKLKGNKDENGIEFNFNKRYRGIVIIIKAKWRWIWNRLLKSNRYEKGIELYEQINYKDEGIRTRVIRITKCLFFKREYYRY